MQASVFSFATHTHTYTHTHTHTNIHTYIHTHTHTQKCKINSTLHYNCTSYCQYTIDLLINQSEIKLKAFLHYYSFKYLIIAKLK